MYPIWYIQRPNESILNQIDSINRKLVNLIESNQYPALQYRYIQIHKTKKIFWRLEISKGDVMPDWRASPVFLMGKSDLRCMVEGSSFIRSDICRLKGEVFWLSAGKPLNEPCRARASTGAWRRGMAWGLASWGARVAMGRGGEDEEPLGPARVTTGLDTPREEPPNTPSESADRGRVRPSHAVTI